MTTTFRSHGMKLTAANLEEHDSLFAILPDGTGVGVENCESEGDIETPTYDLIDGCEWEPTGEFYIGAVDNFDELVRAAPALTRLRWETINTIKIH